MLSKHKDKIDSIKNICISVGTQVLHMNHIMHGIDPLVIRKVDMLTSYAKFIWDTHDFEDFEMLVQDLVVHRLGKSNRISKRYNKDTEEILSSLINSTSIGIGNTTKVEKNSIEQINHDYDLAIDAIQKASDGRLDDIDYDELEEASSHIDYSELSDNEVVDDIIVVQEKLHDCAIEEYNKRKKFEQRIYNIMNK